jgi:phosphonate transport system substrate-binding protein
MAVSTDTLAGANVNDARAAYKVWTSEVTRQAPLTIAEIVPEIFLPSEEIIRDIRQGTIEGFGITALEFLKIADLIEPESVVLQDYLSDGTEYVLLTHRNGPIKKITDLRGAQVLMQLHRDMVLAPAWVGTLLAANNLPQAEHFLAALKSVDNLNQVVLPVFFHRADAACLARRNWETAVELNPQLGRDLSILAVSPKLIPELIAFRRGCSPEGREAMINTILKVASLSAGQQIAALYQSHGFVVKPASVMNGTLQMLYEFERASGQRGGARKGTL